MEQNKMLLKITLLSILSVVITHVTLGIVEAAPAKEEFVYNEQLNACGIFWPGDEFSSYELKDGWETVTPELNMQARIIEYEIGTCYAQGVTMQSYAQNCCKNLGYTYINPAQIEKKETKVRKHGEVGWICTPSIEQNNMDLLINEKEGTCTNNLEFRLRKPNRTAYPTEGQCTEALTKYELPSILTFIFNKLPFLEKYRSQVSSLLKMTSKYTLLKGEELKGETQSFIFPFGECVENNPYLEEGFKDCCAENGLDFYTNVSKDITDEADLVIKPEELLRDSQDIIVE